MQPVSHQSQKEGMVRAVRWTGLSKAISQLATFATTLIITRWILREDFGLFALALTYVALIDVVVDLGFVAAVIQRPNITQSELSSCFWILCATSAILFAVSELVAPIAMANIFSDDRLIVLIRIVSLAFLVVPVTVLSTGLLARHLRLDLLAKIEAGSALSRCLVTLVLAYNGYGVMSLVIGFLIDRLLRGTITFIAAGWRPSLTWKGEGAREITTFGTQVFLGNILWYLYTRLDTLIIGKLLGMDMLGVYSLAKQIAGAFFQFIYSVFYRIAYPVLAQLQNSMEFSGQLLRFSRYLALVALPVFMGITATSPDLVKSLLDPRWADVAFPLQILAATAAAQTLSGLLPQATSAIGRPDLNVLINLVSVPVFAVGFYLGALRFGLEGVLVVGLVLTLLRFMFIIFLSCPLLRVTPAQYMRTNMGPITSAMIMVSVVVGMSIILRGWGAIPRLTVLIAVGVTTYISISFVFNREALLSLMGLLMPRNQKLVR